MTSRVKFPVQEISTRGSWSSDKRDHCLRYK